MPIPKEFKTAVHPNKGITILCKDGLVYEYEKDVKVTKTITKKVPCVAIFARGLSHLNLPHGVYIEDVPFASLCNARFAYCKEGYSEWHPFLIRECPACFYITLEDGTVLSTVLFERGLAIGNVSSMHGPISTIDELLGYKSDHTVTYDSRKEASNEQT